MEQSYKEKYEDILARLERAKNDDEVCDERFCCVIDDLIPELAESKNEKIRMEIINYLQCQSEEEPTRKEIHDKWIAWLENIPVTIDHEKRDGFHLGYKAWLERQGEQKDFAPKDEPKFKVGEKELTNEELCEGLIRGMVNEHNRVTKEVLRNEYEKGRADVLAKIDAIDVDEMVCESGATSRVTQYWYAHGVNDVIKKLKEEQV